MRILQLWFENIRSGIQYNPPGFIELIMLVFAIILLLCWSVTDKWQYLVLCLSYVMGSSISILVREALTPSPQIQASQFTAVLLLILSTFSFADLIR
ncbi:hypothetical protein [Okeania sp. KiyG1]|uniref:hypothetical protein n=1 Tax=Okeania sp. KiyG1 TaxID=2720165 RepID=UPI00192514D3|nr:hypothetical protein [Okeania sp. KiyG1]GGA50045.1 hypothetical protein CYANOKiyG1_69370 [Okeania sp. KiyG1]